MSASSRDGGARPRHAWLRRIRVAFVAGPMTPLLERVAGALLGHFRLRGHEVQTAPDDETDVVLTTAQSETPVSWRRALLFSVRRRFRLSRSPAVYTLLHMTPGRFRGLLEHFRAALARETPDPAAFDFPGLAPKARLKWGFQCPSGPKIEAL